MTRGGDLGVGEQGANEAVGFLDPLLQILYDPTVPLRKCAAFQRFSIFRRLGNPPGADPECRILDGMRGLPPCLVAYSFIEALQKELGLPTKQAQNLAFDYVVSKRVAREVNQIDGPC